MFEDILWKAQKLQVCWWKLQNVDVNGGREQEEEKEPGKTNKLKFLVSSYKNNEVALQQSKQGKREQSLSSSNTNWH